MLVYSIPSQTCLDVIPSGPNPCRTINQAAPNSPMYLATLSPTCTSGMTRWVTCRDTCSEAKLTRQHRSNIPLALPDATPDKLNNPIRPDIYWDLVPKVGLRGASFIKKWGTEEAAPYLRSATVDSVLKWFVGNDGRAVSGSDAAPAPAPAPAPSPSASGAGGQDGSQNGGNGPQDNIDRPAVSSSAPLSSAAPTSVSVAAPLSSAIPGTVTAPPTPVAAPAEKETVTVTIDSCK